MTKSNDKDSKNITITASDETADVSIVTENTIEWKVDEMFSTMLEAYGNPNAVQLRMELGVGGNETVKELLDSTWKARKRIMDLDPKAHAENTDQLIKILALQANTWKKITQFVWWKDTKDPITVPEVSPLMQKALSKW